MLYAYKRFLMMVNDTDNVEILYEYLENTVKAPIDTSDLLRWQWVQCISAVDRFIIVMSKNDCITFLKNAVIRRKQIVHEGDYTDIYSKRQDIFEQDVKDVKVFILKVGKAIYDCVK